MTRVQDLGLTSFKLILTRKKANTEVLTAFTEYGAEYGTRTRA